MLPERFWRKVEKTDTCWLWTAAKNSNGYGHMWYVGALRKAHRIAWEDVHGPIPDGKVICHKCDNPSCVRTDHMFLGTHKDNSQDCIKKGRWSKHRRPQGSSNGQSKLTEDQVREIRRLYSLEPHPVGGNGHVKQRLKYSQKRLGEMFGITACTVSAIVKGETWANA